MKLTLIYAAIKEFAFQNCSFSSLLTSTGKFLCLQTPQTGKALRLDAPFEINQGHIERLAAGFVCGQPGQLVVPYLQVVG